MILTLPSNISFNFNQLESLSSLLGNDLIAFQVDETVSKKLKDVIKKLRNISFEMTKSLLPLVSKKQDLQEVSPSFKNTAKSYENAKKLFLDISKPRMQNMLVAKQKLKDLISKTKSTKETMSQQSFSDEFFRNLVMISQELHFMEEAYNSFLARGEFLKNSEKNRISSVCGSKGITTMRRAIPEYLKANLSIPPENYEPEYEQALVNGFEKQSQVIEPLNKLNDIIDCTQNAADAVDTIASIHKTVSDFLSNYKDDLSPSLISEKNLKMLDQRNEILSQVSKAITFLDTESNKLKESLARLKSVQMTKP